MAPKKKIKLSNKKIMIINLIQSTNLIIIFLIAKTKAIFLNIYKITN